MSDYELHERECALIWAEFRKRAGVGTVVAIIIYLVGALA